MSVVVFALGILLVAAGVGLIGFGIPLNGLSIGGTLVLAGTVALVGGVLMVGLSAVVAELARVAALLRARPVARPARTPAEPTAPAVETVAREREREQRIEPPPPAPVFTPSIPSPSMEVSGSAIERLRTSMPRTDKAVPEAEEVPLSPNGQPAHPVEPRLEPAPRAEAAPRAEPAPRTEPVPRAEPAPRPAGGAAVETREPRLDFLFRPRQARQAPQQQEAFDALWPKRPVRETQPDPRLEVARSSAAAAPAGAPVVTSAPPEPAVAEAQPAPQPPPAQPAPQPAPTPQEPSHEQRSVAILKSGVVDGMAYTLYADGSIEAQLPQGTVRFGSIAELRAHIENHA